MSEKINIKQGDETDVRESVIDFQPLDTISREDDEAWNVMEFYGEDDTKEGEYVARTNKSQKELEGILKRAKAFRVARSILDVA